MGLWLCGGCSIPTPHGSKIGGTPHVNPLAVKSWKPLTGPRGSASCPFFPSFGLDLLIASPRPTWRAQGGFQFLRSHLGNALSQDCITWAPVGPEITAGAAIHHPRTFSLGREAPPAHFFSRSPQPPTEILEGPAQVPRITTVIAAVTVSNLRTSWWKGTPFRHPVLGLKLDLFLCFLRLSCRSLKKVLNNFLLEVLPHSS